jgi:predicted metal-dependent hydrolase
MNLLQPPLPYALVRSRRRTIAIHANRAGIEVRAPLRASLREIHGFVEEKADWIARRLEELAQAPQPFVWQSGSQLTLLGQPVQLQVNPASRQTQWHRPSGAEAAGHAAPDVAAPNLTGLPGVPSVLEVGVRGRSAADAVRRCALQWIQQQALAHFEQRVPTLRSRMPAAQALPVPRLALSNARTLWGSCTRDHRIMLNWRLFLLPETLIDYVVAHELAHLRELNHSPRFWSIVGRLYPAYSSARRELLRQARAMPEY